MNIYKRELRAHIKSLAVWCAGMIFLVAAGMGKYSAGAAAGADSMNALMKDMPESLQNLFGVGVFNLSAALEFYAVTYLYIALLLGVHAVMLGSGIISKEERDKTSEFLLVKPVSRFSILTRKLIAAVTILLIFWLVTYAVSYGMISYYAKGADFSLGLFKLMASGGAIQLLFLSLGAFFAGVFKNPKKSTAAGTGVLLAMFLLSVIADIVAKADFLKYFSFFKYYDAKDILVRGYSPVYPLISVILFAALLYGTYYFYRRRDMEVVLDRKLSEKRIFPAIDIIKSGTRREELLLSSIELDAVWTIRKAFSQLDTAAVTEMIISLLLKTNTNSQFISSVNISFNDKAVFDAMRGTRLQGSANSGSSGQGGK